MIGLIDGVIGVLARVNGALLRGCAGVTIALVAAITVVVAAGVFWRYVLNDALSWSEETAKFLMVWMVFSGAPIALARGGHAAIDALPDALPPRLGSALYLLVHVVVAAFVTVLVVQGYQFAMNARVQTTPTTGISMMYVFGAMPLGGAVMLLIALEQALRAALGVLDPRRAVGPPAHAPETGAL